MQPLVSYIFVIHLSSHQVGVIPTVVYQCICMIGILTGIIQYYSAKDPPPEVLDTTHLLWCSVLRSITTDYDTNASCGMNLCFAG